MKWVCVGEGRAPGWLAGGLLPCCKTCRCQGLACQGLVCYHKRQHRQLGRPARPPLQRRFSGLSSLLTPQLEPAPPRRVSGTHANPLGIKTDAPPSVVWDIIRCWVADHPVKPPKEGSYGESAKLVALARLGSLLSAAAPPSAERLGLGWGTALTLPTGSRAGLTCGRLSHC